MVFWWREHHLSFEQECEYIKKLGYGIELWPTIKGQDDCRYAKRNWSRLKHATEGMSVSMVSRQDGPTIKQWQEQIHCAKMLNAPIVTSLKDLCISDEIGIADWEFTKQVTDFANENNVTICIETGSLPALLQVKQKIDAVSFCLDTGYINIDPKTSFEEYVDQLAEKTTYLHLTDNYGRLDDHEPPGVRGGISKKRWLYLLEKLKKQDKKIIGCLEMFPSMPGTMIRQAAKFLFDVLNWPSPPETDKNSYSTYRPV